MTEKMSEADALKLLERMRHQAEEYRDNSGAMSENSLKRLYDEDRDAVSAVIAAISERDALRDALDMVVGVAETYMSYDADSRFGIAIARANLLLTPSEPAQ